MRKMKWLKGFVALSLSLGLFGGTWLSPVSAEVPDTGFLIKPLQEDIPGQKVLPLSPQYKKQIDAAFKLQNEKVEINGVFRPSSKFVRVNGVLFAEAGYLMNTLGYSTDPTRLVKGGVVISNPGVNGPIEVSIYAYPGNNVALAKTPYVNSDRYSYNLGGTVFTRNGVFYVPVKGILQAMGMEVTWDAQQQITSIVDNLPVLFVHGFRGGLDSFAVTKANMNVLTDTVMQVTVKKNGAIVATPEITRDYLAKHKSPFIIIAFEDNQAGLEKTTDYLDDAVDYVRNKIGFTKFNIVSHSFGGLVSTNYIMRSSDNAKNVNKLVTLASPLNGALSKEVWLAEAFAYIPVSLPTTIIGDILLFARNNDTIRDMNPVFKSQDFATFQKKLKDRGTRRFPSTIQVLSLAGTSDKFVPAKTNSAFGLMAATNNIIIGTVPATHSSIHDDAAVSSLIAAFLRHDITNTAVTGRLRVAENGVGRVVVK